ncbi:MAG: uroporphyrinogen-III synthase [Beijerinckiaceae bacterium]
MLVVVTRGRDEAVRTARKLAARGHRSIVSSVLEMAATGATWPQGVVDAVIATSAQAFDLLKLEPEWPPPEARRLMPLFLVGERTATAARNSGFSGPMLVAPDAKNLATRILVQHTRPARTVYLAGRDRKPDLEARLGEAGLIVEAIEVYEAHAAACLSQEAIDGFATGTIDAVLHYSRRSAEIFLNLVQSANLAAAPLLHAAISADASQPLRNAGFAHIAVAAEPNEKSILALLDAQPGQARALHQGGSSHPN